MTSTDLNTEELAELIAAGGREALVERLRGAYSNAAAAHSDVIALDDARLEAMVQGAADRADGLQWRRALAGVAAAELGIGVTEALSHPAVVRAQTLVGAPTYEQSLADLTTRPVPPTEAVSNGLVDTVPPEPEPEAVPVALEATAAHEVLVTPEEPIAAEAEQLSDELEVIEADDEVFELLPEPEPIELETEFYEAPAQYTDEPAPPTLEPEPFDAADNGYVDDDLRVTAIHLGGVANLPASKEGLDLRLTGDGLDNLQSDDEIVGRLPWDEIDTLEVPQQRSRRRRQPNGRARLVVRTRHGDASFEIPGFSPDELRDRIEPLIGRYGRH